MHDIQQKLNQARKISLRRSRNVYVYVDHNGKAHWSFYLRREFVATFVGHFGGGVFVPFVSGLRQ